MGMNPLNIDNSLLNSNLKKKKQHNILAEMISSERDMAKRLPHGRTTEIQRH